MRLLKGISLFMIYPLLLLGLGFYAGVKATHFFYPGEQSQGRNVAYGDSYYAVEEQQKEPYITGTNSTGNTSEGIGSNAGPLNQNPASQSFNGQDSASQNLNGQDSTGQGLDSQDSGGEGYLGDGAQGRDDDTVEAAFLADTLCVDTEYVIEEMDVLSHTLAESSSRLPDMYVGMNREQFLDAMETYEVSPPLSELELGFLGVEVLSFSRERVVVRKNYKYIQPSESFYLGVYDNEVVVYLEDRKTVYIETDIRLDSLSEELQAKIMGMMWVEDEEKLYSLLENYSS